MKKKFLVILFVLVTAAFFVGCFADNPGGSEQIEAPVPSLAGLRVLLSPETVGNLRASATAFTVKVTVLVADPGNSNSPYFKLVKEVDINTIDSSAQVSFAAIPARSVIVQVTLNNASINGQRMFHAATDLKEAEIKTITPVFAGKGDQTDLVAQVAFEIFNNPILLSGSDGSLVEKIAAATSGLSDVNGILNAVIQVLSPSGLVVVAKDSQAAAIKAGSIVKTAEVFWSGAQLWTSSASAMELKNILRQGLEGYAITHWAHATEKDNAIARLNTQNAERSFFCRNPGKLEHFFVLKDGSVIAAGFNQEKNAPVIFRWQGTADASTYSTSGDSDKNLKWSNYFSDLGENLSGYSIEAAVSDYESLVYLIVKKPDNSRVEYRINLTSGARVLVPGSVEEGLVKVAAFYPELRDIYADNSLSETQRVARFMTYIADDFKRIDGTTDMKSDLEAVTLARFEKYRIVEYKFNLINIKEIDKGTIEVETEMFVKVQGRTSQITISTDNLYPKIIWKRYGTTWKIYQGLPYTSTELNNI